MPSKKPSGNVKDMHTLLTYEPELVWDRIEESDRKKIFEFGEGYKDFLGKVKTEREAVSFIRDMALKNGFSELSGAKSAGPCFAILHEKTIALVKPGKLPIEKGIRLIVSHIDAPRLDLKQRPLYEDIDLTFFKTHYYGGIKKYQWLSRPLAIHGRIVKADGKNIDITIGENDKDPVFTILDLLPHLSQNVQNEKKVSEAFTGEKLNVLIGSLPIDNKDQKDRFKLAILDYLYNAYGMTEEDLISAELEVVPAGDAKDVGLDRALTGAYGQDDRSSAFTSMRALMDSKRPDKTAVALFVDKEEIGSDGSTSVKSKFLESIIYDIMVKMGANPGTHGVDKTLANSRALSADTNAALDPDFQEVHEKRNAARLGYGVCITKFTGSRGKYGANDANAEYIGWLRKILNESGVCWQTGEIGKVDEGGGGTVAKFLAVYGMEIIDCGAPVLAMHSPFEITHKGDIYMTYRAFKTFFETSIE